MAAIRLCLFAVSPTKISALIHARNHALQIGRALDSLRCCDETIVVDHTSSDEMPDEVRDDTLRVAREHGARVLRAVTGAGNQAYVQQASHDWLLCLLPEECVAEDLEASILEWKLQEHADIHSVFSVAVREQVGHAWRLLPAETRLVHRAYVCWSGALPAPEPDAIALAGHILRIPDIK